MTATMPSPLPALPCLCANLRRTSRALTQLYDHALRPQGLRATQFTLLQALSFAGERTQGQLGEILAIDSTTLTRTLAILLRRKWLVQRSGHDRRERWLRLSASGRAQLRRALPAWKKVQSRLHRQLGNNDWNNLLRLTHQVAAEITDKGDSL